MADPSADAIGRALGGTLRGDTWECPCPVHGGDGNKFHVRETGGRTVFICRSRHCSQTDLMDALADRGLWPKRRARITRPAGKRLNTSVGKTGRGDAKAPPDPEKAWGLFHNIMERTRPVKGTLAERYLKARGLDLPVGENLVAESNALHYHPALYHSEMKTDWPALIALIFNPISAEPQSLWRTYIARDGLGKARIMPPRKGAWGLEAKGGMIPISNDEEPEEIVIGEGLESSASAGVLFNLPAWAAVSSGNLKTDLMLPRYVRRVLIAADRDENDAGKRAAQMALLRWENAGIKVDWEMPKPIPGRKNTDFNDTLLALIDDDKELKRYA